MKLKLILIYLFISFFSSSVFASYNQSVVRISSTHTLYDYKKPWEKPKSGRSVGSGVIIENQYILTSAHVVSNAKVIEIKKTNSNKSFYAKVKYIYHQADLALLTVYDKSFFIGMKALSLNTQIKPKDKISIVGYPLGIKTLLVKEGTLIKSKYQYYSLSNEDLFVLEIKAAIEPGNSGGPILNKNGNIVGIVMQRPRNSKSTTYVTPSSIINTFLNDIKDGKVDGLHSNSNTYQFLGNKALQDYYKYKGKGFIVTSIDKNEIQLKINDIIVEVNEQKVSNITKDVLLSQFLNYQIGESITIKVFRNQKIINLDYKLNYSRKLIHHEFESKPRYFIFGGLTFTPITRNYLQSIGMKQYEMDMLFYEQKRTSILEEPVAWMETKFLHNINKGYLSKVEIVDKVNGINIKNFNHFVKLVENSNNEYIVIDFLKKQRVILNKNEAIKSFLQIKKQYKLSSYKRL